MALRAIAVAALLAPGVCLAQLEELENPGTVSAVQERAYRMQAELDLSLGVLPLDSFYVGLYAQAAFGYHFTDYLAFMGRFAYAYAARTGLRERLERDYGVLPTTFEEVQFFGGGDLIWTPFYGKLAVANRSVVHGEVFLMLGATVFKFTNAVRPAVNLGIGGRLFASRWVSIRLDLTDNVVVPTGGGQMNVLNVMTVTLSLALNFGSTE